MKILTADGEHSILLKRVESFAFCGMYWKDFAIMSRLARRRKASRDTMAVFGYFHLKGHRPLWPSWPFIHFWTSLMSNKSVRFIFSLYFHSVTFWMKISKNGHSGEWESLAAITEALMNKVLFIVLSHFFQLGWLTEHAEV